MEHMKFREGWDLMMRLPTVFTYNSLPHMSTKIAILLMLKGELSSETLNMIKTTDISDAVARGDERDSIVIDYPQGTHPESDGVVSLDAKIVIEPDYRPSFEHWVYLTRTQDPTKFNMSFEDADWGLVIKEVAIAGGMHFIVERYLTTRPMPEPSSTCLPAVTHEPEWDIEPEVTHKKRKEN